MAVLRLSSGEVYVDHADINEIIGPVGMTIGSFSYPQALRDKVEGMAKPLDKAGIDLLFGELSASVEGVLSERGIDYLFRRAAVYVPPAEKGGSSVFSMALAGQEEAASAEMPEEGLAAYRAPHTLKAHNIHFSFASGFMKGLQLADGVQAVIYTTDGEWMHLDPTCFNWVIFPNGEPVVGLSYFDQEPDADGQFETEVMADHPILDTMTF